VVQVEDVFQFGREIAVQVGQEPKDTEESSNRDEWNNVIGRA
jgi:hypothetical protein